MKLSDSELKQLATLRKERDGWRKWRWVLTGLGILLILMAFLPMLYWMMTGQMEKADEFGNHPSFYLIPIFGALSIGKGLEGFLGNPTKDLLIKLVEQVKENGS